MACAYHDRHALEKAQNITSASCPFLFCGNSHLHDAQQGLATEGLEWLPGAGNAAVLLCFMLCLGLNANLTQVSLL